LPLSRQHRQGLQHVANRRRRLWRARRADRPLHRDAFANFTPVFAASNSATLNQGNAAYQDLSNTFDPGGRVGQLVLGMTW
jgi:hypothetical protein